MTRLVAPGPDVAMQTPTATGRGRIPLGRVAGALLVAHEDVPHLGRVDQRVVGRQDRAAGDAEDGVDAEALERLDQGLRAGDLLGRRRGRLGRGARVRCRGRGGRSAGSVGYRPGALLGAGATAAVGAAERGRGWACWATSAGVGRTGVAPLLTGPLLSLGVRWSFARRAAAPLMKKPSGPRGTEGQRAEGVGWFACSDALMEYEDSGHAPTVLPGSAVVSTGGHPRLSIRPFVPRVWTLS